MPNGQPYQFSPPFHREGATQGQVPWALLMLWGFFVLFSKWKHLKIISLANKLRTWHFGKMHQFQFKYYPRALLNWILLIWLKATKYSKVVRLWTVAGLGSFLQRAGCIGVKSLWVVETEVRDRERAVSAFRRFRLKFSARYPYDWGTSTYCCYWEQAWECPCRNTRHQMRPLQCYVLSYHPQ